MRTGLQSVSQQSNFYYYQVVAKGKTNVIDKKSFQNMVITDGGDKASKDGKNDVVLLLSLNSGLN